MKRKQKMFSFNIEFIIININKLNGHFKRKCICILAINTKKKSFIFFVNRIFIFSFLHFSSRTLLSIFFLVLQFKHSHDDDDDLEIKKKEEKENEIKKNEFEIVRKKNSSCIPIIIIFAQVVPLV